MGLSTATLELQIPEQHRERLHDMVKATRAVMVLSCGSDDRIVGQPMVLLRTGDDTTMYVATALDDEQVATLTRDPRVTVVVGGGSAMFDAEATISTDRTLLDNLPREAWKLWDRKRLDPAIKLLVISPIEGAYWDGARRHSYQYRRPPVRVPDAAEALAPASAPVATHA